VFVLNALAATGRQNSPGRDTLERYGATPASRSERALKYAECMLRVGQVAAHLTLQERIQNEPRTVLLLIASPGQRPTPDNCAARTCGCAWTGWPAWKEAGQIWRRCLLRPRRRTVRCSPSCCRCRPMACVPQYSVPLV